MKYRPYAPPNNPTWPPSHHYVHENALPRTCTCELQNYLIEYLARRNSNMTTLFVKNEEMDYQSSKFQFMLNYSLYYVRYMYKFRQLCCLSSQILAPT
jgi:hypothetical protein